MLLILKFFGNLLSLSFPKKTQLIVGDLVFKKVSPCEFFVRNKCYTFLKFRTCEEQKKIYSSFFFGQMYILQSRIEQTPKTEKS